MRRAILGTLTTILLLFALSSSPAEPWKDSKGKTHAHQELGNLATKEVRLVWRPEGWKEVIFAPGRKGYLGMTNPGEAKSITIWIRPEHSPSQVAATMVHELAHAFDYTYLTPELRAKWLSVRNLSPYTPWYPESRHTDFSTGAGDFAESVSFTLQGPNSRFKSKLGPPPNEEQQELLQSWLEKLPKLQKQKQNCIRVKKPKGLSVFHHKYEENKDGRTVSVYRIEICEQPPLFWEIQAPKEVYFPNQCTGMR